MFPHIRKYDFNYSRRKFLEKTAAGFGTAGVLTSLWPLMCEAGDITKAYPEELLHIEAYTKGKVKVGDWINADNVELVKDLIDPALYLEVKQQGRKFFIQETTTDVEKMFPYEFLQATIRNQGQAVFDEIGNVKTADGRPWIGGLPFPNPQTGLEVIANMTLSWGRHDQSLYAIKAACMSSAGNFDYKYDFAWAEQQVSGRVNDPNGPYLAGNHDGIGRYQTTWFMAPNDVKGTAFTSIWPMDQRKFPDLLGYVPAFKRVRRFPTNQRFEPLIAGMNFYISDAWAAGDPYLTWGNYKIVGRQPFLGSSQQGWVGDNPNWNPDVHGGPAGETFWTVGKELIPEVLVVEAEPVGFPRAPYSKKRMFVDARNSVFPTFLAYDRRGELFKTGEPGFGQYKTANNVKMDGAHPAWSWTWYHSHNMLDNTMTRFCQSAEIQGGVKSTYGIGPEMHEQYMTEAALRRMGT